MVSWSPVFKKGLAENKPPLARKGLKLLEHDGDGLIDQKMFLL